MVWSYSGRYENSWDGRFPTFKISATQAEKKKQKPKHVSSESINSAFDFFLSPMTLTSWREHWRPGDALSPFQSRHRTYVPTICIPSATALMDTGAGKSERNSRLSLGAAEQLHIRYATSVGEPPLWLHLRRHTSAPVPGWCILSLIVLTCSRCMIYSNCPVSPSCCFTHALITWSPAIERA